MKEDLLGLNHWLSFPATCHTVRPLSSALSSGHRRIAPPKSSSGRPKCFRYHAASAALSPLLLKKTPPIPVIFAIGALLCISPPNEPRFSCGRNARRSEFYGPLSGSDAGLSLARGCAGHQPLMPEPQESTPLFQQPLGFRGAQHE